MRVIKLMLVALCFYSMNIFGNQLISIDLQDVNLADGIKLSLIHI